MALCGLAMGEQLTAPAGRASHVDAAFEDPVFLRRCADLETERDRHIRNRHLAGAREVQRRYLDTLTEVAGSRHWRTVIADRLLSDFDQFGQLPRDEQDIALKAMQLLQDAEPKLKAKKHDEARDTLREAIALLDALELSATATYPWALSQLGLAEARGGRVSKGLEQLLAARELYAEVFGKDQARYAEATLQAGRLNLQLQDYDQAAALLHEAREVIDQCLGNRQEPYFVATAWLALAHHGRAAKAASDGEVDLADKYRSEAQRSVHGVRKLLAISEVLAPEPRSHVQDCYSLALFLWSKGMYEDVAALLEIIVDTPQDPLAPTKPAVLATYHEAHSAALSKLKREVEALESARIARALRDQAATAR